MFGGTNINKDVSALNRGPPNILVGTTYLDAPALPAWSYGKPSELGALKPGYMQINKSALHCLHRWPLPEGSWTTCRTHSS